MRQKSQKLLRLLSDEAQLAEERSKALKISKEIQGFGNLIISPTASTPSSSSKSSRASSFSSYSCDSPSWSRQEELKHFMKDLDDTQGGSPSTNMHKETEGQCLWNSPIDENGLLLEPKSDDHHVKENSPSRWSNYTRFFRNAKQSAAQASGLRSLSDVGKVMKKKIDRQLSLGF